MTTRRHRLGSLLGRGQTRRGGIHHVTEQIARSSLSRPGRAGASSKNAAIHAAGVLKQSGRQHRWWPRFLLTGVLVVVVGATLVSGEAALWVMFAGAAIIFVIACWALSLSPGQYRREPPIPPGGYLAGGCESAER